MSPVLPPAVGVTGSGEGASTRRVLTAARIAEVTGGTLHGDGEAVVTRVAPIDRAEPGSVTFLAAARYARHLGNCRASAILVTPALADQVQSCPRIVVAAPQEALLALLPHLHVPAPRRPGVDPTVRIGRGARIGQEVEIGAYVVIGAGAQVGDRVTLQAHSVVGEGVTVGDDCVIHSHVSLYPGTRLGARVTVHGGARLGSDGFGYVHRDGAHRKIPHVGHCMVGDDVEIGANTTIDRGSIDDTVIGAGTKIDNLVQVGHNVRIGRGCLLMSQVGIAGSVRIGDWCILAGQVGVAGHVTIGDGARVAARGGVFGDIPAGETWSGYPARPHTEALRAQAALFKLSAMWKKLESLLGDRP